MVSDFALFTDITKHIWHGLDESEAKKSLKSYIIFFVAIKAAKYQ